MKKTLAAVVIAAFAFIPVASAQAVSTYGVQILMSGPDVQGSPLTGDFTLDTFDAYTPGTCPSSLTVGTTEGDCTVSEAAGHGGASSESSDPFTGGTGTRFGTTSWGGSQNWPIVLNEPARYLGFWWSSGSSGNTILFYSGEDLVATMDVTGILNKLAAGTMRSLDNNHEYVSTDYYGNPVDGQAPSQPYVYLNVYAIGGTSFDKVVLQGGGFEIDNLTTSYLEQEPDGSLVDVEFIEGLVEPEDYVPPGDGSSGSSGSGNLASTGFEAYSLGVFAMATVLVGTTLSVIRRRRISHSIARR